MAQTIKLKRSSTSGAAPTTSQLELGEVAINTYDGKMYIKKDVGGTESIVEITAGSGGSSNLSGLSDVTISSLQTDQILKYNGSAWVNATETGGTAASAILVEYQFTATASQTTFTGSDDNSETLSYTANAIQVFLNGILLDSATDYTATNGTSVVLTSAAALNDYIQIVAFKKKIGDGNVSVDTFTGDDSTTAFTLSLDPGDENNTRVFIDGVYQSKSNYSVSGTTLTFSTAPPTSTAVEVEIGNRVVTLDTLSDLDLPDDVKLRLGTSQDLQIYHDGSNGFIKNTTGDLYIEDSNGSIRIRPKTGESGINVLADSSVELYYDNSKKLETTNDGVTVTGDVEADEFIGDLRGAILFKAQAGEALAKGDVVYISGISGNTTIVSKADADDASKMPAFGLAAGAASANSSVEVYTSGTISGIDTSSFSVGDEVFTSTTAGALTATAPTGESAALQKIGKVTRSHASSGSLFIIGAGRSNAVPNLNEGKLFVGNSSNQAVADDTVHVDIANSRVGIGTSSPQAKLHIDGDGTYASIRGYSQVLDLGNWTNGEVRVESTGAPFHLRAAGNQPIHLETDNVERVTVLGTGNVGIGTTSPGHRLHISSTDTIPLKLSGTSTSGTGIYIDNDRTGSKLFGILVGNVAAGAFSIKDEDASTTRFVIDSSGNVGIGTTSPTNSTNYNTLDIRGTNGGQIIAGRGAYQDFFMYTTNSAANIGALNDLVLKAGTTGSMTNPGLYLKSGGNVGIGTTSPSRQLEIFEAGRGGAYRFKIKGDTGYTGMEIENTSSNNTNILFRNPSYTQELYMDSVGKLHVYNSSSNRLTIDQSGNVGIGTSSPALQSGGTGIHINAGSYSEIKFTNSTTGTTASDGTALVSSGNDFQINNREAGKLKLRTSNTDALTVDSNSNVGIGTTSPAAKLEVAGTTPVIRLTDSRLLDNPSWDNVSLGSVQFYTSDTSSPGARVGAEIEAFADGDSASAPNFNLLFKTATNTGTATEKLRIDKDGKVGIGTASPERALHVVGGIHLPNNNVISWDQANGTLRNAIYVDSGDDMIIGDTNFDDIYFSTGQKTKTVVIKQTTGNVGIGTSSPSAPLTIQSDSGGGTINLVGRASDGYSTLAFRNNADTSTLAALFADESSDDLQIHVAGSERLRIDSSGNVGIGTTSPNQLLEIQDSTPGLRIHANDLNAAPNPKIELMRGTSSTFGGDAYTDWRLECQNDARFRITSHDSSYGENVRFIIKHDNGNVGIGDINPAELLTVKDGNIKLKSNNDGNNGVLMLYDAAGTQSGQVYPSAGDLRIWSPNDVLILPSGNVGIGTDSPLYGLHVQMPSDGSIGTAFRYIGGTNNPGLFLSVNESTRDVVLNASGSTSANLVFSTTSERMRIDSSGNVGIGTDSPNAVTNYTGLTLNNATYGGFIDIENNGTHTFRLLSNTTASYIGTVESDPLVFNTADTERMRIDSSGNVGIGTTNPQTALHIYDTPAEILRMEGNDEFAYASFYGTVSSTAQRLGYMGFANNTSTAADFNFTNNQGGIFSFNAGIDVNEGSNYRGVHVRGSNTPSFTMAKGSSSTPAWRLGISGYDGNDLAISTGSTVGDQMRMDPSGNVMFALGTSNFAPRQNLSNESASLQTKGPIVSGYSQGSYTSPARNIRDWFVYAGPSTNTGVYVHMKTSLWGGGSPNGNISYTMSSFTYHNYYAYGGSWARGQIGWHNWQGSFFNVTRHNEGTLELVQPSYVSSDGYVVLVARIDAGYAQFSIDWFQWAGYTFREAKVTAVTQSSSATGAY